MIVSATAQWSKNDISSLSNVVSLQDQCPLIAQIGTEIESSCHHSRPPPLASDGPASPWSSSVHCASCSLICSGSLVPCRFSSSVYPWSVCPSSRRSCCHAVPQRHLQIWAAILRVRRVLQCRDGESDDLIVAYMN